MNVSKGRLSSSSKPKKERLTKYETIFDHNPTDEELPHFTAGVLSKEEYLKRFDNDIFYQDICRLYIMRNDKETADKYYLMVSEDVRKEAEEAKKNRVICGGNKGKNVSQFTDEELARIDEANKLALL